MARSDDKDGGGDEDGGGGGGGGGSGGPAKLHGKRKHEEQGKESPTHRCGEGPVLR